MKINKFLVLFFLISAVCTVSVFAASCPYCSGSHYYQTYNPPTCTDNGERIRECDDCGFYSEQSIDALGHNYTESDRVEPSKENDGTVTYICSVCGDVRYETLEHPSPVPAETVSLAKTLFSGVWGLFGVYVPGFGFTIGQLWLGIAICSISVGVLRLLLGLGGSGVSSRTSSTNNAKISDERKGDEY